MRQKVKNANKNANVSTFKMIHYAYISLYINFMPELHKAVGRGKITLF